MDQATAASSEPPSSSTVVSFPTRAFGHATNRYRAFLVALIEGLQEFETRQVGGIQHATAPLPAA